MITGSGLIASVLLEYQSSTDILIFASGVSNSSETNEFNFNREKELILVNSKLNIPIVYFSTCSIFDESLKGSAYVKHKLEMEKIIIKHFTDYYILRLPTLIGSTGNNNTFFNSIVNKLLKNELVTVYKNATRYLLDVDDLKWIVPLVIKQNSSKQVLNVAFNNKLSVVDIISFLKNILKSTSELVIENKGCDLKVDNSEFVKICSNLNTEMYSLSCEKVLSKYVSLYNRKEL